MNMVVTVVYKGNRFWLKGTTWTTELTRADKFITVNAANAAIEKAAKFHKSRLMKCVVLVEMDKVDLLYKAQS